MRIGVQLPRLPRRDGQSVIGHDVLWGDDLLLFVREAEQAGFAHLQHSEHVLGADVSDRPDWHLPWTNQDAWHDPFVTLAFLAGQTSRIELASSILVLPQRQTAVVAKQAAELDLHSRQRLRLGVAIGRNDWEYEQMGYGFSDRSRRLEEQIHVLRLLWTQESVSFDGEYHHLDRAGINRRPDRCIPIWMGGGAQPYATKPVRSALTRIGRLADGWICIQQSDSAMPVVEQSIEMIKDASQAAGRPRGAVQIEGAVDFRDGTSAAQLQDRVGYWESIGATHLSIYFNLPPDAGAGLRRQLAHAAEALVA